MEKKEKVIICTHMPNINPLAEERFTNKTFDKFLSKMDFKCYACNDQNKTNVLWVCLSKNCDYCGCDNDPLNKFVNDESHAIQHFQTKEGHSLFINPFTLQIICLECSVEILDYDQLNLSSKQTATLFKNWPDPVTIRDIFAEKDSKIFRMNLNKTNITNAKCHWKNNKGLCGLLNIGNNNYMNSSFQLLSNVDVIKKIFKKLYKNFILFGFKKNLNTSCFSKKIIFFLSKLFYKIWLGKLRVYSPYELIKYININCPEFRGYGFHDCHEFIQYILKIIDEEFQIIISKDNDLGNKPKISNLNYLEEWDIIKDNKQFLHSSFISDTFDTKLIINYKCKTCNNQFQQEIKKRFLNIDLNSESFSNLSLEDNKEEIKESKLIDYLWSYFNNKTEEIINCKQCKLKTSFIVSGHPKLFPNFLYIRLDRFSNPLKKNDTHIDFPLNNLDLSSFKNEEANSINYELQSIIQQFDDKGRKRFRTIVNDHKNKMYVLFDDALVSKIDEDTIKKSEAYILIYKLKSSESEKKLIHNIKSQMKLIKDREFKLEEKSFTFIPNFWYEKFLTLKSPGFIHSIQHICKHNKLKPDYYDCFPPSSISKSNLDRKELTKVIMQLDNSQEIEYDHNFNHGDCKTQVALQNLIQESVPMPFEIAEYLVENYGGDKLIRNLEICNLCMTESQGIMNRKELEKKLITRNINIKSSSNLFCFISSKWLKEWKNYLFLSNPKKKNLINGFPFPPTINNNDLVNNEGILRTNLVKNSDYENVNIEIWTILNKIYGGGPKIFRKTEDIYSESQEENEFKLSEEDEAVINHILKIGK